MRFSRIYGHCQELCGVGWRRLDEVVSIWAKSRDFCGFCTPSEIFGCLSADVAPLIFFFVLFLFFSFHFYLMTDDS